uniref:Uncharacterized protein n=1 Tax=Branchiostoma floridae TaxID=7739 RepID=C3ZLJ6_BRAFL|eukprot:XP_002590622.1 hypothetical protein BRAFLDRAFT_83725 [Branchiostoma floridae]
MARVMENGQSGQIDREWSEWPETDGEWSEWPECHRRFRMVSLTENRRQKSCWHPWATPSGDANKLLERAGLCYIHIRLAPPMLELLLSSVENHAGLLTATVVGDGWHQSRTSNC